MILEKINAGDLFRLQDRECDSIWVKLKDQNDFGDEIRCLELFESGGDLGWGKVDLFHSWERVRRVVEMKAGLKQDGDLRMEDVMVEGENTIRSRPF